MADKKITRQELIKHLNEDLAREYPGDHRVCRLLAGAQGRQYEHRVGARGPCEGGADHALTIAKQIDYLGGMPTATALPVKLSEDAEEMLRDLNNENDTVRAYRERPGV